MPDISSPRIRLICLILCGVLLLPCFPLVYRSASAASLFGGDEEVDMPKEPPYKTLPDQDEERLVIPVDAQAPDAVESTLASWSPYDFNLNAPPVSSVINITSPSNGATFPALTPVTITASATPPSGLTITQVSFLANGVNIGSDKLTPYSITWSNFTVGTYALTAQATDSHGARTTSPPINITVTASGGPPTVSITSPASGSQYTAPANIPITASATASSGHSISKVEFFAGATLIGTVFSAPYTFNWNNVTANTYSVTAKATDNTGLPSTSSPITIVVTSGSAQPAVSITSPTNGQQFTAPANISITSNPIPGSGRTIVRVDYFANGNYINSSYGFPHTITWNGVPANSYALLAIAFDNTNTTGFSSVVNITVNPGASNPSVSITTPQNNARFTAPASIPITATASACCGRTINKVEFFADGALIGTDTVASYNATFNSSVVSSHTLMARVTDSANATSDSAPVTVFIDSQGSTPPTDNFSNARIDPINRTGQSGEDLFSRNFNWSVPLIGLAGRAGLNIDLSLTYNSLVWTKDGSSIKFNADNGFPGPGFRLGFPTIQQQYSNSQVGVPAYMMILPSGNRIELRRVGSTNLYESADSSYMQFDAVNQIVRSTDGTQLSYSLINNEYRCTQVKDRNGNYITVSYNNLGQIGTITDTLGRAITFNYDLNMNPISITQLWNGVQHTWATFGYSNLTFQTNFPSLNIIGPSNGTTLSVLTQVGLDDGTRFTFTYNSYGQVYLITNYAASGGELNNVSYDLPRNATIAQSDCPRFTVRTDFAKDWNSGAEVTTNFIFDPNRTWAHVTLPDGTIYKEFFATTGYQKGLTTQTEIWSQNVRKKWTATTWSQDNTNLAYPLNPRITESNVYDDANNRRRSTISYQTFTLPSTVSCSQPSDTYEYAADATTVLRHSHTDYNLTSTYISATRRIIGLPSAQFLYEGSSTLMSKIDYQYDSGGQFLADQGAPTNHDEAGYGGSFTAGRGNLCVTRRYNVEFPTDTTKAAEYSTGYNTTGSVIFSRDPLSHQTTISYADSFATTATTLPALTLAYPTTVTNPGNFSSTSQYDYDLGTIRKVQDAKGAFRTTTYDIAGRISRTDISNGAYKRFVYSTDSVTVSTFELMQAGGDEFFSSQHADGAGRVITASSDFPNSTGRYRHQFTIYDNMGRMSQQSNPTETDNLGMPAGDDEAGFAYTTQTYDWKGRPRVTTYVNATSKDISYGGCGCAGGAVATITDEVGRQQRMTYDVLGRVVKTEDLNLSGSVYRTTTNLYNARDQVTRMRKFQGTDASTTFQDTVMTYDGHGRLSTRKTPIESANCVYTYYADDTLENKTDPRGASISYLYNSRHLVTNITYAPPASQAQTEAIPAIAPTAFDYDAAGNRLWMTDKLGRVDYTYDTWSRLKTETRKFDDISGPTFQLSYDYNLTGGITSLTDPFGGVVNYAYNDAGQLRRINSGAIAEGMTYRAWGAIKHADYGNGTKMSMEYNRKMAVTNYEIVQGSTLKMGNHYTHDNDNKVSFARDLSFTNSVYDRSYTYDHVGRLTEGKTGAEARGTSSATGPYRHTYGYDVWDNMTLRGGRNGTGSGTQTINYGASYTNDRNGTWTYDESGNMITGEGLRYRWDAAGRLDFTDSQGINFGYDGDDRDVKRRIGTTSTFYIRSSMLEGAIISEINSSGQKVRGYIYGNGERVARQDGSVTTWLHADPEGVKAMETNGSGGQTSKVEMDPLGTVTDTGGGTVNPIGYYGDSSNPGGGCQGGGAGMPCNARAQMINRMFHYHQFDFLMIAYGREGGVNGGATNYGTVTMKETFIAVNSGGGSVNGNVRLGVTVIRGFEYSYSNPGGGAGGGLFVNPPIEVGFQRSGNQNSDKRLIATACARMAQRAQELANRALKKSWGGHVDYDKALKMFDTDFAREYLGQDPPGESLLGAKQFFDNRDEAYPRRTVPPQYRGQTGFLSPFKEPLKSGQTDNDNDQTHHFAAYLTFGINNQEAVAALHALNDPEGQPDRDLGITAYGLGNLLRKDPTNLQKIAELIKKFCE